MTSIEASVRERVVRIDPEFSEMALVNCDNPS